jgi:hypothetical protein
MHSPYCNSSLAVLRVVEVEGSGSSHFVRHPKITKLLGGIHVSKIDAMTNVGKFRGRNIPRPIRIDIVPNVPQQQGIVANPGHDTLITRDHLLQGMQQGLAMLIIGHQHIQRSISMMKDGDDVRDGRAFFSCFGWLG